MILDVKKISSFIATVLALTSFLTLIINIIVLKPTFDREINKLYAEINRIEVDSIDERITFIDEKTCELKYPSFLKEYAECINKAKYHATIRYFERNK